MTSPDPATSSLFLGSAGTLQGVQRVPQRHLHAPPRPPRALGSSRVSGKPARPVRSLTWLSCPKTRKNPQTSARIRPADDGTRETIKLATLSRCPQHSIVVLFSVEVMLLADCKLFLTHTHDKHHASRLANVRTASSRALPRWRISKSTFLARWNPKCHWAPAIPSACPPQAQKRDRN